MAGGGGSSETREGRFGESGESEFRETSDGEESSGVTSGVEEASDEGDGVGRSEHLVWKGFELPPSRVSAPEKYLFQPLADIFRELAKVECSSKGGAPRRHLSEYEDCASKRVHSEIDGMTFLVDARITVFPAADLVTLADTAVVAEFKLSKCYKEVEGVSSVFYALWLLNKTPFSHPESFKGSIGGFSDYRRRSPSDVHICRTY